MAAKLILALDLGTTGNRAIVFDRSQNIRSQVYEEFPQIYPKPGWVEHDAEAIWKSVRHILDRTFRKISADSIAALGITNQRETIVVWDRRTGRPIHNAIVWQCRRTAEVCEALKKRGLEKSVHRKTGLFLDPYFSATKLAWLLDHVKGARARAERGELLAGTIDTWIIWKLSGGRHHITDSSNASRTLLYDLRKKNWDAGLCRTFRVPMRMLPQIVASSAVSGRTDARFTRRELPIAGIIGDQQAASFAQGCYKPGIIKNTYGTGLFLLENTGKKIVHSKNLLSTVAWSLGSPKNVDYAVEGSVFIGGAAVQWLRDGLGIIAKSADTAKIAASVRDAGGVYFVPALSGLGAPYWDARARGLIIGITRGTTRAHLVRATLESICYQTRDILEIMKRDARHGYRNLRVDGGAVSNDLLMQMQADLIGAPVERPRVAETTALGAAACAGLAVGLWSSQNDFLRHRRVDRVFTPRRPGQFSASAYAKWLDAVSRSRRWA